MIKRRPLLADRRRMILLHRFQAAIGDVLDEIFVLEQLDAAGC